MWTDCETCEGKGEIPADFPDTYFPVMVGCRHCDGSGLGNWIDGSDDDDDGDTRRHDSPYDFAGGRAAA